MLNPSRMVSFAALAALALGCGGDKKPAENPPGYQQPYAAQGQYPQQPGQYPQQQPQGAYPQQQPGMQPQPGVQPQPQPGVQPQPAGSAAPTQIAGIPIDPNLAAQIAAAGAAIMAPAGALGGDPVEAGIRAEAARSAPGMTGEGQLAKDNLPADGRKEMLITLAGGKCYTIIGFSPAGQIKDLDIRLLAPPLYNMVAGQDGMTTNTAIIGKGSNPTCPLTPFPLQYKLDIHAKSGAGAFGVQIFSKNK